MCIGQNQNCKNICPVKFICENKRLFKLFMALDHTGHTAEINWQYEKGHIVKWTSGKN